MKYRYRRSVSRERPNFGMSRNDRISVFFSQVPKFRSPLILATISKPMECPRKAKNTRRWCSKHAAGLHVLTVCPIEKLSMLFLHTRALSGIHKEGWSSISLQKASKLECSIASTPTVESASAGGNLRIRMRDVSLMVVLGKQEGHGGAPSSGDCI